MPETPPAAEPWHLDRHIPIALILAIIGQTAGAVWWASTISSAVADQGRRVALLESGKAEDARADRDSADRLARIEERQRASQDSLVEIKQQLNLLLQRPLAPRTP